MSEFIITGVKPTGTPHLGNYLGAVKPAVASLRDSPGALFIADYHALTSVHLPDQLRKYTRQVAATWLAAGLDPNSTIFYRQSDVPAVTEMCWLFACITPKGMMNRAHAYKAACDIAKRAGSMDLDSEINMGLFTYPILMAVDILGMRATQVPVGRDQLQHVEYATLLCKKFNHTFGTDLPIPSAALASEDVAAVPGLDGRKMSKSYSNTITLDMTSAALRKAIKRIPTDSVAVSAPKDPTSNPLLSIYRSVTDPSEAATVEAAIRAGDLGWGDMKSLVWEAVELVLGPVRSAYVQYLNDEDYLEDILQEGARKAGRRLGETLTTIRAAVGLRRAPRG